MIGHRGVVCLALLLLLVPGCVISECEFPWLLELEAARPMNDAARDGDRAAQELRFGSPYLEVHRHRFTWLVTTTSYRLRPIDVEPP